MLKMTIEAVFVQQGSSKYGRGAEREYPVLNVIKEPLFVCCSRSPPRPNFQESC